MINDTLLDLCADKDLSAGITSNALDLGQESPNLGSLTKPFMLILMSKDAGGTGTVTFKLQDSANNSTFTDILSFTQTGSSVPNYQVFPMPVKHRRYLKLVTTVTGTVTGTLKLATLDQTYELPRTTKVQGYEQTKPVD